MEVLDRLQQLEALALDDCLPRDRLLRNELEGVIHPLVPCLDADRHLWPQRLDLRRALHLDRVVLLLQIFLHLGEHIYALNLLFEDCPLHAEDVILNLLERLLLLLILSRHAILHLGVNGREFLGEVGKLTGDILPPAHTLLLGRNVLLGGCVAHGGAVLPYGGFSHRLAVRQELNSEASKRSRSRPRSGHVHVLLHWQDRATSVNFNLLTKARTFEFLSILLLTSRC